MKSQRDQATELRSMIRDANVRPASVEFGSGHLSLESHSARTIAVTSGKGGVGKSVIALNLAIAFAQQQRRVCILDADLGLGNIDLMCGMNAYWNLSDFLRGDRSLDDIMLDGPGGIKILPGASGLMELADSSTSARSRLLEEFSLLETKFDELIVDCGTGIHPATRQFASAADLVLLVTTREATSIADTYAALKVYRTAGFNDVRVVINRADERSAAVGIANLKRTALQFLNSDLEIQGCIPEDSTIVESINKRTPAMILNPKRPGATAIQQISRQLVEHPLTRLQSSPNFVSRLFVEHSAAA